MTPPRASYTEFVFHDNQIPCLTCLSTLRPEGKKNIRRNTGAVLRVTRPDSGKATIVIDVGKNFLASALEWFPKYGLRRIDAVLITHAHADALYGLDDLRGWTLGSAIQSHIDVYVSAVTFGEVQRAFPYLISKEFASGGGDVAQFMWHIIEANIPFIVGDTGVEITPFAVHHGRLFGSGLPSEWLPTPVSTHPSTPCESCVLTTGRTNTESPLGPREVVHPYICFGFVMLDIVYMSDVSHIPEDAWATIESARKRPYSLFVVDCLRVRPHTSHFGLAQAVSAARRLGGIDLHTYVVGLGHELPHSTWLAIGESLGRSDYVVNDEHMDEVVESALRLVDKGPPVRLKPGHDGLRLCLDKDGLIFREDD